MQWLSSIEEEVKNNCHLINSLIGRGPDAPLEIDENLDAPALSLTLPRNLSFDLLARRPDLMAEIWRVEALAHEVGAATADFYPNINLTAFAGLESIAYQLLFRSKSKTIGVQPAIHLPIFTAGAIRANVRAKKAEFDAAVDDYNNLLLKSAQEVADLLAFAQSVCEQREDQMQIVNAAEMRFTLTSLRQQSGLDPLLSQYAIQEEWIQKELAQVSLIYNQYLATIKLIKALGGGYLSEYSIPIQAKGGE
jgi:NodT family efflux transporter outer membrane factor (OMF) lipoprotein